MKIIASDNQELISDGSIDWKNASRLLLVLLHRGFVANLVLGGFGFVLGLIAELLPLHAEFLGDIRDAKGRVLLENVRALILGEKHVRGERALGGVRVLDLLRNLTLGGLLHRSLLRNLGHVVFCLFLLVVRRACVRVEQCG